MKLLKQCTLDGVTRRKDKSLKISFITNLEQSSAELMEIDKLLDTNGILYYKESEHLTTEEISEIDKVNLKDPEGKTPAQRLRNKIYGHFKRRHPEHTTKEQFADFYNKRIMKYEQYETDQAR